MKLYFKQKVRDAMIALGSRFKMPIFYEGARRLFKYEAEPKSIIEAILSPIDYIKDTGFSLQKLQRDALKGIKYNLFDRLAYVPKNETIKQLIVNSWLPIDAFPTVKKHGYPLLRNRLVFFWFRYNIFIDFFYNDPLSTRKPQPMSIFEYKKYSPIDIYSSEFIDDLYCPKCKTFLPVVRRRVGDRETYKSLPEGSECACGAVRASIKNKQLHLSILPSSDTNLKDAELANSNSYGNPLGTESINGNPLGTESALGQPIEQHKDAESALGQPIEQLSEEQIGAKLYRRIPINNKEGLPYFIRAKVYEHRTPSFYFVKPSDNRDKHIIHTDRGLANHINLTSHSSNPILLPLMFPFKIPYRITTTNEEIQRDIMSYYQAYARLFNVVIMLENHLVFPSGLIAPYKLPARVPNKNKYLAIQWFTPIVEFFRQPLTKVAEQIGYKEPLRVKGANVTSALHYFFRLTAINIDLKFKNMVMNYVATKVQKDALMEFYKYHPLVTLKELDKPSELIVNRITKPLTRYPLQAINTLPMFFQTFSPSIEPYMTLLYRRRNFKKQPTELSYRDYYKTPNRERMLQYKILKAYMFRLLLLSIHDITDAESVYKVITSFEYPQSNPEFTSIGLDSVMDFTKLSIPTIVTALNTIHTRFYGSKYSISYHNSLPSYLPST